MTTKELLALVGKATPGPWQLGYADSMGTYIEAAHDGYVAIVHYWSREHAEMQANAALIVAAVNALPALCAEVEALRKDAERWRAYERELPDSADSTRVFLHGVAVLKAAKLAAKEPK